MRFPFTQTLLGLLLIGASSAEAATLTFFPRLTTVFPAFVGGGFGGAIDDHFQADCLFGLTPKPYYQTIGAVSAEIGGNPAYADVIEAAFQNNWLWRVNLQYNFNTVLQGWSVGASAAWLQSSGQAGIDKVLGAATGRDYTTLKNLLVLAGKSTIVDMRGDLFMLEIHGDHAWLLRENLSLTASLGVVKVIASEVHLQTGLPAFEASPSGSTLLRSSESDLEDILSEYGISPTLAISLTLAL